MALMNQKLHIINKSGVEVTYNLFSSKEDWKNSHNLPQTPCLHVMTNDGEGMCPLISPMGDTTYSGNLNVKYGNTTYYPVNVTTSELRYESSSRSVTDSYGTTVYKTLTRIYKSIDVDYDIVVIFYDGSNRELFRTDLPSSVKEKSLSVTISSTNGFKWSSYIPTVYQYRTLTCVPYQLSCTTAIAGITIPSFIVNFHDYDHVTRFDDSKLYIRFQLGDYTGSGNNVIRQGEWKTKTISELGLVAITRTLYVWFYYEDNSGNITINYEGNKIKCRELFTNYFKFANLDFYPNITLPYGEKVDRKEVSGQTNLFSLYTANNNNDSAYIKMSYKEL